MTSDSGAFPVYGASPHEWTDVMFFFSKKFLVVKRRIHLR